MTTTQPTSQPVPTVKPTPAGTFLLALGDDTLEVTHDQLENLATAARAAYFDHAPTLTRVTGNHTGTTITVLSPEQTQAALAEAWPDLIRGLACPHCDHVAWDGYGGDIYVADHDERWSRFGYEYDPNHRHLDGTPGPAERLVGSYAGGTNYEGIGYRCAGCFAPVTLPDGVDCDD